MRLWTTVRTAVAKLNPFRQGFLVAADLRYYFEPVEYPDSKVPSWARLAWLTRKAQQTCLKHWFSEGDIKSAVDDAGPTELPYVQAWLHRIDIRPWLGPSVAVYCTEIVVAVGINGEQLSFGRRMAYRNYADALADFNSYAKPQLRWTLRSSNRVTSPLPSGPAQIMIINE